MLFKLFSFVLQAKRLKVETDLQSNSHVNKDTKRANVGTN